MRKNVVVVGAGINGIVFANLMANKGYKVRLIETEQNIGGNFKSISIEGNKFDRGLFIPQMTGQKELDDILIKKQNVNVRFGVKKDIAGCVYKKTLNKKSIFVDISKQKKLAQKIYYEMTEKYGVQSTLTRSCKDYFKNRFGNTAFQKIFKNIIQNILNTKISDYDIAALKVFHLSRLIFFKDDVSQNIKSNRFYNDRVAYPNQMKIPKKFIQDKTPSFYPKNNGLYHLISSLASQLINRGVEVHTETKINKINIIKDRINDIEVEIKNQKFNFKVDQLIWCANTYALNDLLDINSNVLMHQDPPIQQQISYIITSTKPNAGNIYWLWDYDNNPVMRLSFPHNFSHLNLKGNYVIILEHSINFNKKNILDYLTSRKILKKENIISIHSPKEARRFYFNFTMNNIQKDADFIEIVENLELRNLNLCSAKVSRNIFYLHDVLLDGYEKLKKNGVLNAYH